MEAKYSVNGGAWTTWNQLLFFCFKRISDLQWKWQTHNRNYGYDVCHKPDYRTIEVFFSDFRHNPNDGIWAGGYYKRIPTWNSETKQVTYANGEWIPKTFTPHQFQVKDSYGRIVPSSVIKIAFKDYVPNYEHDFPKKKPYYNRWNINLKHYHYRNGPVPGIHCHQSGWWRRSKNWHAGRSAMKRQWYRDEIYSKEVFEEFGITFKMDGRENHHYSGRNSKGKGWKRTRKKKQWM
jgi:hypothetical protein